MKISINKHSSIKITTNKTIYFDPYLIETENHDADIIFITHDHHDHFSIEDIKKVEKEDTVFIIPENMYNLLGGENVIVINPNEKFMVEGYEVLAVASYNVAKEFHPKEKGNVGYVVTIENKKVYVCGDSDMNPDNSNLKVDIALVPVGGHYTMDAKEAATFINKIKPELAIPTHYGTNGIGKLEDGLKFKELVDDTIKVELLIKWFLSLF